MASGALPVSEQSEIETHLARCAGCRQFFTELRSLAVPLANWEKSFAHIEPGQTFQGRWENAIRSANESKPVRSPANEFDLPKFWREWLRPFRYAWAGMTALWLVMVSMNFGLSRSQSGTMTAQSAPTATMLQAFEEQRRVLAELVPAAQDPVAVAPPHHNDSRPRSARQRKLQSA
jgi:hypothetical protein